MIVASPPHEVTLRVQDAERVRVLDTTGAESPGRASLDASVRERGRLLDAQLRDGTRYDEHELQLFGSLLWRAIFPPEVESFVAERADRARAAGASLRVQLVFERGAERLASLPWEYLYGRSGSTAGFLAVEPGVALTRYLPRDVARQVLAPPDPPLRLLAVVSAPRGLGPVMAAEPLAALEALERTLGVEVCVLKDPTIDRLIDRIERVRPHAVHLMGHGDFDFQRDEGSVALVGPAGSPKWVPDQQFAQVHGAAMVIPRMFVLHLCEGGAVGLRHSFAGVAPRLVRNGVPAVVAMQRPITNRAAIDFVRAFYGALSRKSPVDEAVQAARRQLRHKWRDSGEFGIPVLYLHGRDGVLV